MGRCCVCLVVLAAVLGAGEGEGQERPLRVDFLDERLIMPESERFREADYTESGVGLSFGVDRRLSYLGGNYEEAVARFEAALKGYRFKSEIWVYLARSYFYMKSPAEARRTIERAAAVMPDLKERFWDPLLESLLGEIRRRAFDLQMQVDYYPREPGDFLNLFRLYAFVEDRERAAGVARAAQGQAVRLRRLAEMGSAAGRETCERQADRWQELATQLGAELQSMGYQEVAPAPQDAGADRDLLAATRLLQLRVDYYSPTPDDFRQLFANYRALQMADRAAGVAEALRGEIGRAELLTMAASSASEETEHRLTRDQLQAVLDEVTRILSGEEAHVGP